MMKKILVFFLINISIAHGFFNVLPNAEMHRDAAKNSPLNVVSKEKVVPEKPTLLNRIGSNLKSAVSFLKEGVGKISFDVTKSKYAEKKDNKWKYKDSFLKEYGITSDKPVPVSYKNTLEIKKTGKLKQSKGKVVDSQNNPENEFKIQDYTDINSQLSRYFEFNPESKIEPKTIASESKLSARPETSIKPELTKEQSESVKKFNFMGDLNKIELYTDPKKKYDPNIIKNEKKKIDELEEKISKVSTKDQRNLANNLFSGLDKVKETGDVDKLNRLEKKVTEILEEQIEKNKLYEATNVNFFKEQPQLESKTQPKTQPKHQSESQTQLKEIQIDSSKFGSDPRPLINVLDIVGSSFDLHEMQPAPKNRGKVDQIVLKAEENLRKGFNLFKQDSLENVD